MPDNRVVQVGGTHYGDGWGHWDWVEDIGLSYLGGCLTKYIVRHPQKNGRQDVEKALTYAAKMQQQRGLFWMRAPLRISLRDHVISSTNQLITRYRLPINEAAIVMLVAQAVDPDDMLAVEEAIAEMLVNMPADSETAAMNGYLNGA